MSNPVKSFLINERELRLLFRKVFCPQGFKYFITTHENKGEQVSFEMKEQEDGKWKIVLPAPEWILPLQEELSLYINSLSPED